MNTRLPALALLCICGCALPIEGADDITNSEQTLSFVAGDNFEGDALGPLAAPWTISGGGASHVDVVSTTDHGKVAALRGSKVSGDFVSASLPLRATDAHLRVEVQVKAPADAAFVFSVHGGGPSLGARSIRLQKNPGSESLIASSVPAGNVTCGALSAGAWHTLVLEVQTETQTFSVSIDGAPSACAGASSRITAPFDNVSIMDASNDGYGGEVLFDDISVSSDAKPACTPPATPPRNVLQLSFDTDPLGNLAAPWSVSPSGTSTARVVSVSGGRALQLHGGTRSDTLVATRSFAQAATQTDLEFALSVRPVNDASFVVFLNGAGASLGARSIRLQRAPGSTVLAAQTVPAGTVSCGDLASNAASVVSLRVHTAASQHTFDVLIGGRATACTGLATGIGAPFDGVGVMDASNQGWGGDTFFDDLSVIASGPPSGSCP